MNIGELTASLGVDTTGLSKANKALLGFGATGGKVFTGLTSKAAIFAGAAGIGAIVYSLKKATDAAGAFQKGMANVSTLVDTSIKDMRLLEKGVLNMSVRVNKGTADLTRGLYQTISAGVDTSKALGVLEVAAKAAAAGLSDTFSSVDAITSVLNAYGLAAEEATDVSDLMFQTVRLGKTTFEELTGAIGTVISPAAAVGVKLEDLFATIATLTKGGLETRRATTAIRAALLSIIKPSDEAKKTAKELGIEWSANAVQAKGLIGFFNELKEATGGNSETIAKLVPNARAITAVLAAVGKQSSELNRILAEMKNRLGSTEEAFKKQEDTYEIQKAKLGLLIDTIQIKIGKTFLPALTSMLEGIIIFFQTVSDEFELLKSKMDAPVFSKGPQKIGQMATASIDQINEAAKAIGTTIDKLTDDQIPALERKLKELYNVAIPKVPSIPVAKTGIKNLPDFLKEKPALPSKAATSAIADFLGIEPDALLSKIKAIDNAYLAKKAETYNDELMLAKQFFDKDKKTREQVGKLYADFEDAKREAAAETYNLELKAINKRLAKQGEFYNISTASLQRMLANENLAGTERQEIWDEVNKRIKEGNVGMWESFTSGAMDAVEQFGNSSQMMMDLGRKMTNSLADSLGNAFYELAIGVKNFKEAFRDMAIAFGQEVLRMITRLIALRAIQAATGIATSFFGGPALGGVAMAGTGMVMGAAGGGIIPKGLEPFANGGTVKQPTVGLVGEGRYNEAVVPLPDGRSIPVDMRGYTGGGDTYQISINAVDAKSFAELIERNPQTIVSIVSNNIRGRGEVFNDIRRFT